MKKYGFVLAACAVMMLAAASPLTAIDQVIAGSQVASEPAVTLKVTVTISKWNGDKKISSAPFILMVVPSYGERAAHDGDATTLQMGSEVPVPSTTVTEGKSVPSVQYRTIGTNISSAARPLGGGAFNVYVAVQDTQLDASTSGTNAFPRMQNFRASNRLTMRDGATVQFTVATDTVTGNVTKLDVTMTVVK